MNDLKERVDPRWPRAVTLTRRRFGMVLCATFLGAASILSFMPTAFAGEGARTPGGDRGDQGGNSDRDGDADGRGRSRERTKDGDTDESSKEGRDARNRETTGDRRTPAGRHDHERAQQAVSDRQILSLKDVLNLIDTERYGIVIAIDMGRQSGHDIYRMKTRDGSGVIHDLRIDARTGQFLNTPGF